MNLTYDEACIAFTALMLRAIQQKKRADDWPKECDPKQREAFARNSDKCAGLAVKMRDHAKALLKSGSQLDDGTEPTPTLEMK